MPLIAFEAGKLSEEVKYELIQKLTDISSEITGIPKSAFFISIREMPDENVAIGGKTVKEIKKELGRE
ncbi:MAG: tautomerase family protein [Nitrospinae bacterium]|nr:tautomerase family protein [Nitrospinota bacterium]